MVMLNIANVVYKPKMGVLISKHFEQVSISHLSGLCAQTGAAASHFLRQITALWHVCITLATLTSVVSTGLHIGAAAADHGRQLVAQQLGTVAEHLAH